MVGFDSGEQCTRELDGIAVSVINPDLSSAADLTVAKALANNPAISHIGASMHGPFEVTESQARQFLRSPNVHGRPNSDVVRIWANAKTITQRQPDLWIVDPPPEMSVETATFYEAPFEYLRRHVLPVREQNRRPMRRRNWWLLGDPQKAMRNALGQLDRFILTPRVAKHRLFVWANPVILPTDATVAFASADDSVFGILHSRCHELWARAKGTQLREEESGFRYTPNTCFLTFPFPEPTGDQREAISKAAKKLDELRNNWLIPYEFVRTEVLEFPGSVDGPWRRFVVDADARGIGIVKYPRVVPKDAAAEKELKTRTLTNLYNLRPAWLDNAHKKLDEAVLAAYGWPMDISDEEICARLLELNRQASNRTSKGDHRKTKLVANGAKAGEQES